MRFWFEHSGEVSLHEQIVAQVTLGILCGELAPGERLPSIRELARRFGIHANTVSTGYSELVAAGWLESRKGSGVYVRAARPAGTSTRAGGLDRLTANLFAAARRLGIEDAEVKAHIAQWTPVRANRVLLIEPDVNLRAIVGAELEEMLPFPVEACGPDTLTPTDALLLSLPSKAAALSAQTGRQVFTLRIRSVPESMQTYLPHDVTAHPDALIGVASGWGEFRRFARTMLIAAGFEADALIVRDTHSPAWHTGLEAANAVVCDVVTAQALHASRPVIVRILAEDVGAEVSAQLDHRS